MADQVNTAPTAGIPLKDNSLRSEENHVNSEETSRPLSEVAAEKKESVIPGQDFVPIYFKGLRLHAITASLCLCLFLVNIETPIVSTSLVGITNSLKGFEESSWIVTAYLVTYVGFLIIWAKINDIFGRKLSLSITIAIFILFSGLCGAAQTITQLIVFRAFQGIGGAGIYSLSLVIFFDLAPPAQYATYTGFLSIAFSLSLLIGPIIGGAINDSSTWRWVFLFNVPTGVVAFCILLICIPRNYPCHGQPELLEKHKNKNKTFTETIGRVDFIGAAVLLTATILLVTALEEAGTRYSWRTGFIIAFLVLSGIFWIVFVGWEWKVTKTEGSREPVFPFRFLTSRVWIGMMLNAFFLGAPFTVAVFSIPQRYQVVNGLSPLQAGVRLIPFSFASPLGSILASVIAGKVKVPPIYIVIMASIMQAVGFSLLSTISVTTKILHSQYGFQVITGLGVGANISTLILMTPFCVEKRDQPVAIGSVGQFRLMGGAIGLAIVTAVLNTHVKSDLTHFLPQDQISTLLESAGAIAAFPPDVQKMIQLVFAQAYNNQMKVLIGFSAAQIVGSLVMWQKK